MQRDWSQFGENAGLIESLYQLYCSDPSLVDPAWISFFSGLNGEVLTSNGHHTPSSAAPSAEQDLGLLAELIASSFRRLGHLKARFNPLKSVSPAAVATDLLDFASLGPKLQRKVSAQRLGWTGEYTLSQILQKLESCYCGSIGYEFDHLEQDKQREWLCARIEAQNGNYALASDVRRKVLKALIEADGLESELHRKFVGQTRFSAEGGESLMPMLDLLRENAPSLGIKQLVFGMAHRARLNVLCNILEKPLSEILAECEDNSLISIVGSGDVKYHMGYESTYLTTAGNAVTLQMAPNPSHLEFVNPVVQGITRAVQDFSYSADRQGALGILIHGDAAYIGQGIVWESMNLSKVPGYTTGGTLHIVINNQIGFTTDSSAGKSTRYCTDMGKVVNAPVIHVNAENPEACCWAIKLAVDYRNTFGNDVIIDLVCYRKYGHNEGDDPTFTQPVMYSEIKSKRPIWQLFIEQCKASGDDLEQEAQALREAYKARFEAAHQASHQLRVGEACAVHGRIRPPEPSTKVTAQALSQVASALITVPSDFTPHPKLKTILEKRVKALGDNTPIEWGLAEGLAFGTLLLDEVSVRLSGQDCGRGTFSQRHVELTDNRDGRRIFPLSGLAKPGVRFEVYNSPLSEAGVMGFEFGYSSRAKRSLVLWEAQYGDFCNGAQVIIDQFLANSEEAWGQLSGLVLLLPHGFEGQGPEHSTARLERFLQLASEGNMTVAYPSTASQHFHLLRRQGLSVVRRPLIIMTPKSLLRSPAAGCRLEQLVNGSFETVIEEEFGKPAKTAPLLMMCGKIYHDLTAELAKAKDCAAKIVRIEQLYPFPETKIKKILAQHPKSELYWVQEEPKNMGAWSHVRDYLNDLGYSQLKYIGRPASASTATGSHKSHAREQKGIVAEVLKLLGH